MAIDVPYPQLVQQNGLTFSRGQCALDSRGRVLRPNDLLGQTDLIVENLIPMLEPLQVSRRHLVRAVAYYKCNGVIGETEFRRHLANALKTAGAVTIVPVPLSDFYYDGMMVEIDFVFAEQVGDPVKSERRSQPFADALESDDFLYLSQLTPILGEGEDVDLLSQVASIRDQIEALISQSGGAIDDIVKLTTYYVGSSFDWARIAEARAGWFERELPAVSDVGVEKLGEEGVRVAMDAIAVRHSSPNHWRRQGIRVPGYGRWPIDLSYPQAVRVGDVLMTGGQLAVNDGHAVYSPYEMSAQTRAVMNHLEKLLEAADMSFADVIKATTYYRGGADADDLHENLQIRSGYYSEPGPASTGVPVVALPAAAAMISVELTAIK